MANINDVFGEYDESKPIVKFNLPKSKSEILGRLVEAGFPFATFLKEFHDNPESPVTKSIDKEAQNWPFYSSLAKPILKGEKPDFEMAAKEFALAGSQPGGPAKALGSLPIKLNKSNLKYVIRPEKPEEILKLQSALREAVKKGEMTKGDAEKLLVNAVTNMHEEALLEGRAQQGKADLYEVTHPVPENPIEKSTVVQKDAKKYDDAFGIGNWLGHNLKIKPQGKLKNSNEMLYLQGDQGPLWINEHNADAANVRHNLTNYDALVGSKKQGYGPALKYLYDRYPSEGGYIQRLNLKDGSSKELYKTIVEPQALNQISGPKLGYNYKKAQNTPVIEGRKATEELPNYKTVDEFYKIILGLK